MWQSRPVFISSTFADMQAERDYLRTRVFPELEERLRARRHNLEWVDLRVGVATASQTDEHVRELHVLKVCLDEVRRCRPFLIVLLGDRYGWVPPEERIKAAAEEAREGFSADVAGRSVTDLEIEFGVLSDPEQQPRTFFYFREPLPYADMPAEIAALYCEDYADNAGKTERKERLAALKRRIGEQLPTRIRRYALGWDAEQHRAARLEDFGRMVLGDIWSDLDAETATSAAPADIPWQQTERAALDDFIDDRSRDFIGRRDILDSLTGLAVAAANEGGIWGASVTGHSGSGKSALFGELYRRLHGRDVFLLAHAAGASVNAASVDLMLRRWIGELAGALDTDPGLMENADADTVESTFARLLGQLAQRQRIAVLVDALDQFENTTRGRHVTWLPRLWPANARLIATAIPGDASNALVERQGVESTSLPPLDAAEARDIVAGICRRYHRTFEPEIVEALLAKRGPDGPAWGNPLWLVLAVEDLNLLDADDFARAHRDYPGEPAERLRALMLDTVAAFPSDIPGLYAHTFGRAEDLFGATLARGFLGLISVSRGGWRESDFRVLLPRASGENWDELKFAQLRRLFRGQLRRRGALGQWDFSHAQMRAAVGGRLATWGIAEQSLHTIVADRLLSCPTDDPLHISETMVHLLASKDYDRAARYYGDSSLTEAELQGATRVLADSIIAPRTGSSLSAAQQVCRLVEVPEDSVCAAVAERILIQIRDAAEQAALLDARAVLFNASKRTFERLLRTDPGNTAWQRNLSVAYDNVGDVQLAQDDLAGAMQSYRNGLSVMQHLVQSDPGNGGWQRDLSVSYKKVGDVLMAQRDLGGALESYRAFLAIQEELVQQIGPGNWRADLSVSYGKVGDVLYAQGDLAGAMQSFRYSLETFDMLARVDPRNAGWRHNLSASYGKVGDVLRAQGDLAGAIRSYRDCLAILQRLTQSDPGHTGRQRDLSVVYGRIGEVLLAQGDSAGALKSYCDGVATMQRLAQSDPGNAVWQRELSVSYDKVGDVLKAQGDLAGALKSYRDGVALMERLAQSDPGRAGWQRDLAASYITIGDVQAAQGDLAGALKSYRDSLETLDALARSDPVNAVLQGHQSVAYDKVGGVLKAQGDLAGAMQFYRGSLTIRERLVQSDPGNAVWQHGLGESYEQIGDLQVAQGDSAGALKSYCDNLIISERLARSDPGSALWQADLSVTYARVGGVQVALGDMAGARKSYGDCFAIRERLVQSDPGNAVWQRDLVVPCMNTAALDPPQARAMLTRAQQVVNDMQAKGILAPSDAWLTAELANRIAALPPQSQGDDAARAKRSVWSKIFGK